MQIYAEYILMQWIIKTSDTVLKKNIPLTLFERFVCPRELETEQRLQHIDLPSPSGHRRVSFSFFWAAQPGAWGSSLTGTCSHSSIFSPTGLRTNWLPVFTELYNSSIAHSIPPHNLPSEMCHFCCLWNGMFDCHRAEITVMQFTGHSLPVHQSMTVSRDFTLSHFVSQARLRDFFP